MRAREKESGRKETRGKGRRKCDRKRRPRTLVKNKTQGRRGAARRLATCLRIDEEEGGEERQKIERKKRDEMGGTEEVPVEGRNITPAMLARHRDVLQPRRRTRARFIG